MWCCIQPSATTQTASELFRFVNQFPSVLPVFGKHEKVRTDFIVKQTSEFYVKYVLFKQLW